MTAEWDRALQAKPMALALRRCRCGEPLGRYATICADCFDADPRRVPGLPGDLDDDSEAEHFRNVDIEADLKDEGQHIDPSRAF